MALIRRSYLVRSLLRCLADGNYNRLQRIQPLMSLYLLQLGDLMLAARERGAVLDVAQIAWRGWLSP